jgi:hypothetical protein
MGRKKLNPRYRLVSREVPEPVLARFKAGGNGMAGGFGMAAGVTGRRAVAAADVPALRTTPQVKPPSARREALGASITSGHRPGIDVGMPIFQGDLSFNKYLTADCGEPAADP